MLFTVGHGALDQGALGRLLVEAGIRELVDVRRFPGSRAHPHVSREALTEWLPPLRIGYRWEEALGGRRSTSRDALAASPDTWWSVAAFRAYAGWTRSDPFRDALEALLRQSDEVPTAVMCSESVWWRCHRRLIADVVVLAHGRPVSHLMHDGRLRPHLPSEGARLSDPGTLVWDGPRD